MELGLFIEFAEGAVEAEDLPLSFPWKPKTTFLVYPSVASRFGATFLWTSAFTARRVSQYDRTMTDR